MNIIVTGDSFCAQIDEWPSELARLLGVELIAQGFPGRSWWPCQQYLADILPEQKSQCRALIICHTNSWRIHSDNPALVLNTIHNNPESDTGQAMQMYIKHIQSEKFDAWSHRAWIREIDTEWADVPRVHLHSFSDTVLLTRNSTGLQIHPDLCRISLELSNRHRDQLFNDTRPNHLDSMQNKELARQLASIIGSNVTAGIAKLDKSKFKINEQHNSGR